MNTKFSLRVLLRPLIKKYAGIKYRFAGIMESGKLPGDPLSDQIQNAAEESRRIAEKLQDIERLAKKAEVKCKYPADIEVTEKHFGTDQDDGQVLCGWREEEDERYYEQERLWKTHQLSNPPLKKPELEAALKALFLADLDAAKQHPYRKK